MLHWPWVLKHPYHYGLIIIWCQTIIPTCNEPPCFKPLRPLLPTCLTEIMAVPSIHIHGFMWGVFIHIGVSVPFAPSWFRRKYFEYMDLWLLIDDADSFTFGFIQGLSLWYTSVLVGFLFKAFWVISLQHLTETLELQDTVSQYIPL